MKAKTYAVVVLLLLTVLAPKLHAQLTIPGADGSDGALTIISNTVIDLSQAISGVWSNNNSANAGKGIYDSNKWAVVFKYSSVNIASNATVTFQNHPSRAPVVWVVSGNATVFGEVNLSGNDYTFDNVALPEPGPGGYRGGAGEQANLSHGSGFGPGGYHDDNGGYSTYHSYGNPQILPLIGGSGGSAGSGNCGRGNGAGGGGAIMIAAVGNISVSGRIRANGGNGYVTSNYGCGWSGYYGSGGAVRLLADQILGSGRIEATGSDVGRIRLEANTASTSLDLNPSTVAASPNPVTLWPTTNAPTVKVISVAAQSAPLDPKARMNAGGDDLTIANTSAVSIVLQTANFPINGTVNVFIKPRNSAQSILQATYVSGTTNLATWQVTTTLPVSHTVIQARAVSN